MRRTRKALWVCAVAVVTLAHDGMSQTCPPPAVGPQPTLGLCDAYALSVPNSTVGTHKVARLRDPAQEQVAIFDLYWGGALRSLTYGGREYIDQTTNSTTAGLVQIGLHNGACNLSRRVQ